MQHRRRFNKVTEFTHIRWSLQRSVRISGHGDETFIGTLTLQPEIKSKLRGRPGSVYTKITESLAAEQNLLMWYVIKTL